MSPVCLLFYRWMFVVSGKHLLFVRFICSTFGLCSFGNIRLINPFYVCTLFVATSPCSLHVRSCVQCVSQIWRTGDFATGYNIFYTPMYADPVRLSVTGHEMQNRLRPHRHISHFLWYDITQLLSLLELNWKTCWCGCKRSCNLTSSTNTEPWIRWIIEMIGLRRRRGVGHQYNCTIDPVPCIIFIFKSSLCKSYHMADERNTI